MGRCVEEELTRELTQAIAALRAAERRCESLEEQLAGRRCESDLLLRLLRERSPEGPDQLSFETALSAVVEQGPPGIILVNILGSEMHRAAGSLPKISADALLAQALPWEEIGLQLLSAVIEKPGSAVHLAPSRFPELEQACGQPLAVHCAPVDVGRRTLGFVALLTAVDASAGTLPGDNILCGLAHHIALRLGEVQLRSELQGFVFSTVKSLVAAVDAKDPYTRGHSERVHYLALRTGEQLGLGAEELRSLSWAALLHDIGKIAIPNAILCKPGKLTSEEWDIIRTHPERGCRVIEPIPQLADSLPGIRHHHERWDGAGYPAGLAQESIPLQARIIAVADAFDAITSDRAYVTASTCEKALGILDTNACAQFDPAVVVVVRSVVEHEMAQHSLAFQPQRDLGPTGRRAA